VTWALSASFAFLGVYKSTTTLMNGCLKYAGKWKEDKFNGKGKCHFPSGEIYVGDWVDNFREGKGVTIYDNNSSMATYQGFFADSKRFTKFAFSNCH